MSERVIAEFSDFVTMQLALQTARELRGISFDTMDQIAGTPEAYFSKVLAPGQLRRITMTGLSLAFGALGIKCLIVDDPEQLKRIESRLKQRNGTVVRNGTVHQVHSRRFLKKIGAKGGDARAKKLPAYRRQAIAKQAALIRWNDVKKAAANGKR